MKTAELTLKKSKGANITAWTLQVVLSLMFIMTGAMKSFLPVEQLSASLPWVAEVPGGLVRFIGLAELLGGFGLILPSLFKIKTRLTPLAALGIVSVMVAASIFHVVRGEMGVIGMNIVLAGLAGTVAWLRLNKAPLQDKVRK